MFYSPFSSAVHCEPAQANALLSKSTMRELFPFRWLDPSTLSKHRKDAAKENQHIAKIPIDTSSIVLKKVDEFRSDLRKIMRLENRI